MSRHISIATLENRQTVALEHNHGSMPQQAVDEQAENDKNIQTLLKILVRVATVKH